MRVAAQLSRRVDTARGFAALFLLEARGLSLLRDKFFAIWRRDGDIGAQVPALAWSDSSLRAGYEAVSVYGIAQNLPAMPLAGERRSV